MLRLRFIRTLALVVALVSALAACGGDASTSDRFARRFLPWDSAWIPLAEVADAPSFPSMVIWEISETLEEPSPQDKLAAHDIVERCYESARRHGWQDIQKGLADGFELIEGDKWHYRNKDFLRDGLVLDPDRPEFLMYYENDEGGYGLAGFMFMLETIGSHGPQFAGPLSLWHYHVWPQPRCFVDGSISLGFGDPSGTCEKGVPSYRSPEMIHVWLIDHPSGNFGTAMALSPENVSRRLKERMRKRGF